MQRYIESIDTPLEFGRYSGTSLRRLAEIDPSYLVWLWQMRVIRCKHKEDHEWLQNTCKAIVSPETGMSSVEEVDYFVPIKDIRCYKDKDSLLGFGKYAHLTFSDVSELDPTYFLTLYTSKLVVLMKDTVWYAATARRIHNEKTQLAESA